MAASAAMTLLALFVAAGATIALLAWRAKHARVLRDTEKKWARIFRSIPDPVCLSTPTEGEFVAVNDVFLSRFGYSREELEGRTTFDIGLWHDPADRPRAVSEIRQQGGKLRGREILMCTKSGEVRTCLASGEVIKFDGRPCFLAILHDVTELKRAEEELKASEAKFSLAFHVGPDPSIIASFPDGEILDVNEAFSRAVGYDREEVVGRLTKDIRIWADLEVRAVVVELLERKGRIREMDVEMRKRTGEPWEARLSAERVLWGGRPVAISIFRDVTELKRSQEERERFVEELEAKNAELERFVYTVSHDLKSPLVTIRGFLGFLERDVEDGNADRARHDIDRILNATEAMKRLLEELLELSRVGRQRITFGEVDLAEVLDSALELVGGTIAERGVEIEVAGDLPVVVGDRRRLQEVFQNLVDNAVKFIGGAVCPRIEIGARNEGDEVVCFVRDNGVGIEPRYQKRIFGLFERLDSETEGTGVGLALVKRIVEVHGGRIWVESDGAGRGSTFWWTLPASRTP